MIITTANKVSRARLGLFAPCSMMAAMLATSMKVTDSVSSNVPKGSPRRAARYSAWRTTASDEPRMAANSHTKITPSQSGWPSPANNLSPRMKKASDVSALKPRNHS